jgi:hypothetical protein
MFRECRGWLASASPTHAGKSTSRLARKNADGFQVAILYEDRFTRAHNLNLPTITFSPRA